MLDQDMLVSVCTIIEGAPRVDAKGLYQFRDIVSQVDANPLVSELHTLRHLLSDVYDPLTSAARRQSHVHPIVRSVDTNMQRIDLFEVFHRLPDHSDDHLNIKSMPFSLPSPGRMKLNGAHRTCFPHNGRPATSLPLFQCTDIALLQFTIHSAPHRPKLFSLRRPHNTQIPLCDGST